MSEADSVLVHILDKEYRVACPPGEKESLLRAASYLDEQMREVKDANVIGLERIAIMAALNISHEYLQTSGALNQQEEGSQRLTDLISRVDEEIRAFEEYRDQQQQTTP
jgi:cell division protein ZapA